MSYAFLASVGPALAGWSVLCSEPLRGLDHVCELYTHLHAMCPRQAWLHIAEQASLTCMPCARAKSCCTRLSRLRQDNLGRAARQGALGQALRGAGHRRHPGADAGAPCAPCSCTDVVRMWPGAGACAPCSLSPRGGVPSMRPSGLKSSRSCSSAVGMPATARPCSALWVAH